MSGSTGKPTDTGDIVRAAQRGDTAAFEQLVARFQALAVSVGYAMLGESASAQDVAQEAFIEAYLCLPNLREPAAFAGWFRRIVVKQCDRIYRRARPPVRLDEAHADAVGADPAAIYDESAIRAAVRRAVGELPPAQRTVAEQYYLLGLSQQEIMEAQSLAAGTVKKRLFDARRSLRARLAAFDEVIEMQMNHGRSQSEESKRRVMYFIALNAHDLARAQRLLDQSPALLAAPFEWDAGPLGHYWPRGHTALHWAAATDDRPLLDDLLARGAAVDTRSADEGGRTPLHIAALMGRPALVERLLDAGASINAADERGHTALHLAAWANQPECAAALLRRGASPDVRDGDGRTPAQWAAIRNAPEIAQMLGGTAASAQQPAPDRSTRILETGVKIIDLCAPFARGGVNALFSPRSGVGKMVTADALIYAMAAHYGGHTIWLGLDHGLYVREGLELAARSAGLAHAVDMVTARQDEPESYLRATDAAVDAAQEQAARGHDALLLAASPVALADGVLARLRAAAHDAPAGAITVVLYGDQTAGAEPEPFAALDAVVAFENWRAQQGMHPSVDVLNSHSRLLEDGGAGDRHARLARQTRRLLRRYQDVTAQPPGELRGLDGLPVTDDAALLKRARLLHEFLTQPLPDVELLFQRPAVYVPLRNTLEGCEAILDGRLDRLAEGALLYRGALDADLLRA